MSLQKLPVPADFATRARDARNPDLCAHYGVCRSIVIRWRKESGVKAKRSGGAKAMPVPADFADIAAMMLNRDLAARYGVCLFLIKRWRNLAGVPSQTRGEGGPIRRRAPEGFAEIAPLHGAKWLATHFSASLRMVRRWYEETGVERFHPVPKPRAPKLPRERPAPARERTVTGYRKFTAAKKRSYIGPNHLARDASTEGQAADVLRRETPVYRCTERGAADPNGSHWRYGNGILTGAELVERAKRRGFDPDAWRRIGLAIAGHEADKFRRENHG